MISSLTQCIECGGDGMVRSTCPRCGGDGWVSKEYEPRHQGLIDADELLKKLRDTFPDPTMPYVSYDEVVRIVKEMRDARKETADE